MCKYYPVIIIIIYFKSKFSVLVNYLIYHQCIIIIIAKKSISTFGSIIIRSFLYLVSKYFCLFFFVIIGARLSMF